jgi:hypothetical protein
MSARTPLRTPWTFAALVLVVAVAGALILTFRPSSDEGGLGRFSEVRASNETLVDDLCKLVSGRDLAAFGLRGSPPQPSNSGLMASCRFAVAGRYLEVRLGAGAASVQDPQYEEPETSMVEVAGADRAAVVNRPLYPSDDSDLVGFTVLADFGDDLVQVVVSGEAIGDARRVEAVALAGRIGLLLPGG